MAANMARKMKSPSVGGQDEWSVREKLILASSVLRSGDQNWVSVSRTVKPIAESGVGVKPRPPDFFSQKSCAAQYSEMLEKVATPKRKRTNEAGGTETPGEQIVRTLTFERIDELKKMIKADQMKYRKLKSEIEMILSGKCDDRLPMILESLQNRPKPQMEPPTSYNPAQQRETMKPPQYPQPVAPSSSPTVSSVQQPLKSPVSPSPQKMKNLRVPKPTERFQKYQQQQQARHGHSSTQSQQQQQYKQQLNALEQLQKHQQLQQLQQQLQMHQQQFQQQQQLQPHIEAHNTLLPADTPPLQDHTPPPQQFFRSNGQQEMIIHQQQQQLMTSAVQASFASIPDKSHLTQLVQPGHNMVNKDVTAMDIDVPMDKQSKHKVSPNVKETSPAHEAIVDNAMRSSVALNAATSSGLLSTLLTASVNEIKHVAETMNQGSIPDQERNDKAPQMSEPSLSFLDGSNLSGDLHKSRIPTPSAAEVAPTLSKLLKTTASINGKVPNTIETPQTKRNPPTQKSDETWLAQNNSPDSASRSRKPSEEGSFSEILSDKKEAGAKEHFDKEFVDRSVVPPKVLILSDDVRPKPEKRRPGRPRTRKPPKETEEDEADESIKEVLKSSDAKLEADDNEERLKKSEDDLKREDKAELSVHSSFGSESVPDSPASQISQSGSDDLESLQAQKNWKKSIMLVWRAAANHKYANVFLHPVTDDEAPGYHNVIYRPMDLSTIKKNIESGVIRKTDGFQRDMMLMFQNALMYNSADHDVYRMAEEMREDVMEQIQSYIATQLMVQSDRESKMLRGHKTDVFHFSL